MDIHQLKQRIDASGKKLVTLGNEYIKSKDEIAARKVLVKMFGEISQQTLLLGEQNAELDKKVLFLVHDIASDLRANDLVKLLRPVTLT